MGVASRLLLLAAVTVQQASSLTQSRQGTSAQVSLQGLWDGRVEILSTGGALIRKEIDAPPSMPGSVARRFMARDGLQAAEGATFDASSALKNRLHELQRRCPGALGQGWALLDAAQDTEGGHHWVLRGPGVEHSTSALLHVSSAASRTATGSHAPLGFSPGRLCHELPAALLANAPGASEFKHSQPVGEAKESVSQDVQVDEPEQMQLSNSNVQYSVKVIEDKLKSETAEKCQESGRIASITALSARSEVAGGLNVLVTTRVIPAIAGYHKSTYHVFSVDWTPCASCPGGMNPELQLPTDNETQEELGWCDLLTKSSEKSLASLSEAHGPNAQETWLGKLGLLTAFRDFRPEFLEVRESGERKAANCIAVAKLPDTYDPRVSHPDCLAKSTMEDQGTCASCWAFSTAHSLAARACIKNHRSMITGSGARKQFSKQQMMSCNSNKLGCGGGSFPAAFEEARKGLALEEQYPYYPGHAKKFPWSGTGKRCQWGNVPKPWIVTAHYPLQGSSVAALQQELYCKGPTTVGFMVMTNFFSFFNKNPTGVYTKADAAGSSSVGGHAVTLVGWGLRDKPSSTPFWECMNSWGANWGNGGFFRMERGVNLCKMETMTIHAGDIEPTEGSWMYGNWGTCEAKQDRKRRPINCKSNDGRTDQMAETCPTTKVTGVDATIFPQASSTKLQEVEAFKTCSDTVAACTKFGACKGNGNAAMASGTCKCTCFQHYEGGSCDQCTKGASGYPRCRERCVATDCSLHGVADGNKWKNEFHDARDSCTCSCHDGFKGDSCNACANNKTHTYPNCHGSFDPMAKPRLTTVQTTTTTTTQCRVKKPGPIELMPPNSTNWLVLNCDVRRRADCQPDIDQCKNGTIYKQYCQWTANTTEFPSGQCLNKANASKYHAKIEGTEVEGEQIRGDVNKSKLAFKPHITSAVKTNATAAVAALKKAADAKIAAAPAAKKTADAAAAALKKAADAKVGAAAAAKKIADAAAAALKR